MDYYNEISEGYNELHKAEQLNKVRIIISNYDFTNKKILDIGSGPGYLLEYLIENNINFKEYTGIDPSVKLMKLSKYYKIKIKKNKKFIKSKIEDFKFKKKYDIIVIISSIHHFDKISIIKKIRKYAEDFIFSVYRGSRSFDKIKRIIENNFNINNIIKEEKDTIYLCK